MEPTNDLDTDMLAAMEDLLDTYAGTLLVVSHDRYLIERVTDQQYAILGGGMRHLPRGVEEYLELQSRAGAAPAAKAAPVAVPKLGGAELRNAQKEIASVERRLQKQMALTEAIHARMAEHDQNDYVGLGAISDELRQVEQDVAALETRWLELTELLS